MKHILCSKPGCITCCYTTFEVDRLKERLVNILVSDRLKECLIAPAINYVMNLEGDAFFEPARVAMLADTYAYNYQDGTYKGNQITQLDAKPKGKNGISHNNGKVQTDGVVAKGTYSTSNTPKVTEDRKVGARLCFLTVCVFCVNLSIIC